jgi:hypothetical protein
LLQGYFGRKFADFFLNPITLEYIVIVIGAIILTLLLYYLYPLDIVYCMGPEGNGNLPDIKVGEVKIKDNNINVNNVNLPANALYKLGGNIGIGAAIGAGMNAGVNVLKGSSFHPAVKIGTMAAGGCYGRGLVYGHGGC